MTDDLERTTVARGWSADWLNGWLAAIGATVVLDGLRLSWRGEARPVAVLHHPSTDDVAAALHDALPTDEQLAAAATARELPGLPDLPRNFDCTVLGERARYARDRDDWSIGPCVTDLVPVGRGDDLPHGPFDVPAPKGITLHERVVSCRGHVVGPQDVAASIRGTPTLATVNGLGFDARRLEPGVPAKNVKNLVDPVVEVLAWCALVLFPAVPDGEDAQGRGWTGAKTRAGAFRWGTWVEPMDRWAIDAALDSRHPRPRYETVPYQPSGSSDPTRAYASRRVRDG